MIHICLKFSITKFEGEIKNKEKGKEERKEKPPVKCSEN